MQTAIQNSWLFSELTRDELKSIERIAGHEKLSAGHVILRAGHPNDSLWIVGQGSVSIHKAAGERPVAKLEVGDIFGEMSWLDGFPASSFVIAGSPCELVRISFHKLNELLYSSPELHIQTLRKFAINLSHRLR